MGVFEKLRLCARFLRSEASVMTELAVLRKALNDRVSVESEMIAFSQSGKNATPEQVRIWALKIGTPREHWSKSWGL